MNISHAFDWTREGLLAELDVLMHNKAAITDELVDYKMKVAMLPGRKEARDSINEYRRSIDQNPDRWQLFNLVHRLPNITVPSLLIWGVEDRFALIELGRRLTKVLPNTEYVEVADASHHGFRDRPEVYNDLLLRFFQAAAAGRKPAAVGR
jgi:pimeloyl-ACP methyl ester carboxylesterase